MVWRNEFFQSKYFVYLHRIDFQFLHQLNKLSLFQDDSPPPYRKEHISPERILRDLCKFQIPLPLEGNKKPGEAIRCGFLFYLFFFRSLNHRILRINLDDFAMNFWSSWKRSHKMSDYNQQSVITAECHRPILKKPGSTSSPSCAPAKEKAMSHNTIQTCSLSILG